jgi:hypothetical protein
MEKTFNIAGHSILDGVFKFRFANSPSTKPRTTVLERNGHTDIALYLLPTAMEKTPAIEWVKAHEAALAAAQQEEHVHFQPNPQLLLSHSPQGMGSELLDILLKQPHSVPLPKVQHIDEQMEVAQFA